jgi:hypothetical protein
VVAYGRVLPEPTAVAARTARLDDAGVKPTPRAWTWSALMRRAFAIDVLACAHCGGRLRLITTLHDPAVIRKILAHLALSRSGQSPGPAPPDSGATASSSDRLGGAADAVVPAPRGGIAADHPRAHSLATAGAASARTLSTNSAKQADRLRMVVIVIDAVPMRSSSSPNK